MSTRSETLDFILFLLKLAGIMLLVRMLVVSPFNIPSESMQPRLLIGDYLLVAKWPYGFNRYSVPWIQPPTNGRLLGRTPERGDVVVFAAPANPDEDWIKRVIGLPGDRVQMVRGTLFLNGSAVPKRRIADLVIPVSPNMIEASEREQAASPCFQERFEETASDGTRQCRYPRYRETLPGGRRYDVLDLYDTSVDNTQLYIVPEGHVFVMGDNRDRSKDSRFPLIDGGVGMLPMRNLIGRAMVTFYSTDGSASWANPATWLDAARTERIGEGF